MRSVDVCKKVYTSFKCSKALNNGYVIKLYACLKKCGLQTLEIVQQAYDSEILSLEDDPCAGGPSTSITGDNEQRVRHFSNSDHCLNIQMVEEKLEMDKVVGHKIITEDLRMRRIGAKLVPKALPNQQNQNRKEVLKIFWNALKKTLGFLTM